MKRLSRVSLLVLAILASCADPMEERTTNEVGAQLQRGMTGQGRLGPIDRPDNDPASQHSVPQGY
ncbi:MAG TPA: hypothetical protein VJ719_12230 [Chthoniobacterales bacterium]|nr:hypothetical protein [Chthoniobacterales bacterium]